MQERGLVIIIAAALALCGCEASSPEELASKAEQKASAARFEQIAKLADQSCMCAMAGRDTSTLNLELERLTASLKKEGMGTSSVPLSGELTCYPELGEQACIGRIAFTHSPAGNFVCTEVQEDELEAAWKAAAPDAGTNEGFNKSLPKREIGRAHV